MNIKPGIILAGVPSLEDLHFTQALIFITEHNEKGAMGFIVNKPFYRTLNELEEFKHIIAFPLHDGGPVDKEHLFFIHKRPDLIPGGTLVSEGIYFGGDFKQAVQHLNNGTITASDIKIFVGYSGWDDGQLEEEIEEGSWVAADDRIENVF